MTETLKPELKPCPLCSGTSFDAFTELDPPELGRVRCCRCDCSVTGKTLANAIAKWNCRNVEMKLRMVCAEAYQFAGAYRAPESILNAISDASQGFPGKRVETFLPVAESELEKLAREVATDYRERGSVRADRIDALAAHFAEQDKHDKGKIDGTV